MPRSREEMIRDDIKALSQYAHHYMMSFENAIADWDEPWEFQYLFDLVTVYRGGKKPTNEEICYLAGVSKEYWNDFIEGKF